MGRDRLRPAGRPRSQDCDREQTPMFKGGCCSSTRAEKRGAVHPGSVTTSAIRCCSGGRGRLSHGRHRTRGRQGIIGTAAKDDRPRCTDAKRPVPNESAWWCARPKGAGPYAMAGPGFEAGRHAGPAHRKRIAVMGRRAAVNAVYAGEAGTVGPTRSGGKPRPGRLRARVERTFDILRWPPKTRRRRVVEPEGPGAELIRRSFRRRPTQGQNPPAPPSRHPARVAPAPAPP